MIKKNMDLIHLKCICKTCMYSLRAPISFLNGEIHFLKSPSFVFTKVLFHCRYKNIPHMSFDDTGREPEQAFRLNRDPLAELEYPTKWEHVVISMWCSFIRWP